MFPLADACFDRRLRAKPVSKKVDALPDADSKLSRIILSLCRRTSHQNWNILIPVLCAKLVWQNSLRLAIAALFLLDFWFNCRLPGIVIWQLPHLLLGLIKISVINLISSFPSARPLTHSG